jgi:putative Mn2+ efflux pump MntP
MDYITRILIAFSLTADAFAVSITNGICSSKITKKNVLATAFTFGFFQALMPILGFLLGRTFSDRISRYQYYIALFLLAAIGINMIHETIREQRHPDELCTLRTVFTAKNLILQGIATSIDALAVGVSFAAMRVNIATTSLIIGGITFLCCIFGVYIGRKFGNLLGLRARLAGGILLILIGIRIFWENFS